MNNPNLAYGQTSLPLGIHSRFVPDAYGVRPHLLEAGFESAGRPCVVLLQGFPEPLGRSLLNRAAAPRCGAAPPHGRPGVAVRRVATVDSTLRARASGGDNVESQS
jgi:hypothetical protein